MITRKQLRDLLAGNDDEPVVITDGQMCGRDPVIIRRLAAPLDGKAFPKWWWIHEHKGDGKGCCGRPMDRARNVTVISTEDAEKKRVGW